VEVSIARREKGSVGVGALVRQDVGETSHRSTQERTVVRLSWAKITPASFLPLRNATCRQWLLAHLHKPSVTEAHYTAHSPRLVTYQPYSQLTATSRIPWASARRASVVGDHPTQKSVTQSKATDILGYILTSLAAVRHVTPAQRPVPAKLWHQ
jgi:hypothetical protein